MSADVERIRNHPSDYLADVASGVVMELVALSVVEHTHAPNPVRIRLRLTGPRSAVLTDNGRGMRLEPDRGDSISHAERALTSIYPVLPSDPAVEIALRDWCWGERGSLGPVVANSLCEEFVFESRRDGEAWTQLFERGLPQAPASRIGSTGEHGTTIRFRVDAELAGEDVLDAHVLTARFKELSDRIPELDLELEA